jgi:hypothetical protein
MMSVQAPELDDRDLIEARTLRRRRVLEAFLSGGSERAEPWAWRGLLLGIALTLAIAVVVGIAGLVDASRQHHP